MIDTIPTLAECPRCGSYVLTAQANGCWEAADPTPLGVPDGYRAALIAGRRTFTLLRNAKGKPFRLVPRTAATVGNPETCTILGEHACGAPPRDCVKFQEAHEKPSEAVCDLWRASGWEPPASCPRRPSQSHTGLLFGGDVPEDAPASCNTCEAPPFDRAPHCDNCQKPLDGDPANTVAIWHGQTCHYKAHERCT